ncbi:unnamed protein product [Rotaria sp. Silwood1]|nr:unnamed protein product [Rotaria sp. Silwood1]CAF1535433.1 unnamed protein product [Rotaria sp. Silwood1]CAF1536130.1 unnamed protein product [Rotaria sp. Silwood1]CAF3725860.1 unnamed protein product [Rotaria sp. Silwood1]CAF3741838.1 unnamed protein product [Rotaria sp. Silwood1]
MKTRRHTTDSLISSSPDESIDILPSTSTDEQSTKTSSNQHVIQSVSKSSVWQYFERCTLNGILKAKCLLCQHILSTPNYGTSTLKRHLDQVHDIKQTDSSAVPSSSTISNKISKPEKKALDLLAVNAIIQDARGFGDLQKPGIKKLIDALKPRHHVDKKFDQHSKMLQFMQFEDRHYSLTIANEIENQLINLNLYDKLVTITCDGAPNMREMFNYFSRRNIKYIHCTAHKLHLIICNSLNLWVTTKKKGNTTENEEVIEASIIEDDEDEDEGSLSQLVRTMSFDTDPLSYGMINDDSEGDETSKEDDDVDGELESNDQLTDTSTDEEWTDEEDDNDEEIVDNFVEGINMDETSLDYIPQMIKDVIDKTREIINTIKGSSILTSFIEKKRLHFNARAKKQKKIKRRLIIDVKTRWNSTYRMLHTINLYRNFINDLFKSKGTLGLSVKLRRKLTRVELSTDEWDSLNLIISLLYPFYSATKVLSNAKYPTVGSALYLLKGLEEHLTKEDNNELLNNFKKIILNKFRQYIIDDVEQFNTLKVSGMHYFNFLRELAVFFFQLYSYFDPTGFSALTRGEQTTVEKEITKLHKNVFSSSENSSSSSNQQMKKMNNIDKAWHGFLRATNKDLIQEPTTTTSTIQSDIRKYRNLATKLYV